MVQTQLISLGQGHSGGYRAPFPWDDIGILGCATSPELCGQWLTIAEGVGEVLPAKTFGNIGEVDHSLPRREAGFLLACK